ncbi:MAG: diadenylate cyclase CdaA, partial [Eubacteriales bacterium]|nr:diadenylate cyclase CdaA [Eubacteriales bacterium]
VFIYIIMNWIRETRAWSLFKGILVILVLSILSVNLNLYTTSWIIGETLSVGIIAILVLFQPEFRKGLEQIGKSSLTKNLFLSGSSQSYIINPETLEAIVEACFKMSENKTGALIVVEQNVPLGDFDETGIEIDAIISSQLLINIFENKTPLHDGAVTIRNNRISCATCILPLSSSEMASELGTRHRAGMGASEISDAYIFIVSEETGSVSIANNGKLSRNLSKEVIIKRFSLDSKSPKSKIKIWKGGSK